MSIPSLLPPRPVVATPGVVLLRRQAGRLPARSDPHRLPGRRPRHADRLRVRDPAALQHAAGPRESPGCLLLAARRGGTVLRRRRPTPRLRGFATPCARTLFAYASPRVVDAYAFAASVASHPSTGPPGRRPRPGACSEAGTWSRVGQAALAAVGARVRPGSPCPIAGALIVTLAAVVVPDHQLPGLGTVDESPLAPPRAGTGMTGWLVLILAPVLIPIAFLASELALIRLGLVIHALLV